MPEHKLSCPECNATLKFSKEPTIGKKVLCPKCGHDFKITENHVGGRTKSQPPALDEDDEGGTYGFHDDHAEEKDGKTKKSVYDDPIKDPFGKSKRLPAQDAVMKPSNLLLASGLLLSLFWLIMTLIFSWNLMFKQHWVQPRDHLTRKGIPVDVAWEDLRPEQRAELEVHNKAKFRKELPGILLRIVCSVLAFVYSAAIAGGAAKMQNLESYMYAMVAGYMAIPCVVFMPLILFLVDDEISAIVAFLVAILSLPAGIMTVKTLNKPLVIAGYREEE
ncbi:MAG: hypothetical protein ACK4RK_21275 [Gemmataceae bacterium]